MTLEFIYYITRSGGEIGRRTMMIAMSVVKDLQVRILYLDQKANHWLATQLIDKWTHMRHNLNIEHKFKTKNTWTKKH